MRAQYVNLFGAAAMVFGGGGLGIAADSRTNYYCRSILFSKRGFMDRDHAGGHARVLHRGA